MGDQLAPTERHAFRHEGRVVYEWDQTLEEVNMYVEVPPGVTAKVLAVRIDTDEVARHQGQPPYLEHRLTERVKTEECYWTLEDGELHLQLQKLRRGKPWESLFEGHGRSTRARAAGKSEVDGDGSRRRTRGSTSRRRVQRRSPDPSTFMGGVGHDDRRRSLGTVETWGRGDAGLGRETGVSARTGSRSWASGRVHQTSLGCFSELISRIAVKVPTMMYSASMPS